MSEIPANSKEENSPQEQQQRSNANQMPRPNLNLLPPQPRFPVNGNDESDEDFGDEDAEDKKEEEKIRLLEFWCVVFGGLGSMLISKLQELQLERFLIEQEKEYLKKKFRRLTGYTYNRCGP